jgi:hypothetical protein
MRRGGLAGRTAAAFEGEAVREVQAALEVRRR